MKIVFFGTPHFVIPVLEALEENFEVVAVVTTPDEKVGRDKILTASPVKQYFKKNILVPESLDEKFEAELKKLKPDLLVVAAYGKIIPLNILNIAKHGALNIHPSLLPKYRGASPIQQAILNGDNKTGVSIIKMDEKMDHGLILIQAKEEIKNNDTAQSLYERLFQIGSDLLYQNIKQYIKGELRLIGQDHEKATFTKILTRNDGYFELSNPPSLEKLDLMIRAYFPWPSAWTRSIINSKSSIIKFLPQKKLQVEGKKPVSYKDFINGYPNLDKKLLTLLK